MILERFLLTDQVAVRDRAGRGIGAASAIALAEAGADVVISARTEADLDGVAVAVEALVGAPRWSPATSPTSRSWPHWHGGEGALRSPRRRGQQPRGTMPLPLLDTTPEYLEERSTSTWHAMRWCARPAAAPRGRRGRSQHLSVMGGSPAGASSHTARPRRPRPLHPPRGEGPRPAHQGSTPSPSASTATRPLDIVLQSDELPRADGGATPPGASATSRGHRSRRALPGFRPPAGT